MQQTSSIIKFFVGIFICILFHSCKKDTYSFSDELAIDISQSSKSFVGLGNSIRLNTTSLGDTTTNAPGLPILLESKSASDIVVQGEIDTSLIAEYNELYHENNPTYEPTAFSIANNGQIAITAGSLQSKDTMFVILKKSGLLVNNGTYLIPVRTKILDGSASLKTKLFFVKMKITIKEIYGKWKDASRNLNTFPSTLNGSLYGNYKLDLINDAKLPEIGSFKIQAAVQLSNKYIPVYVYGRPNVSDTMLQYFNKTFNVQASLFPTGSYTMPINKAKINTNSLNSADSIEVKVKDFSIFGYNKSYILPIEVYVPGTDTAAATPDTLVSRIAFISLTINHLESANIDSLNPIVTGTMINKQKWTASATASSGSYTANFPSNAIDGSLTTYWASLNATPQSLYIDMKDTHKVKGFRLTPQYATIGRDFIRIIVYSSMDSITWKQEGYYFGTATKSTTSATNPDFKYIHFNNPVTARYFQFNVVKSTYAYGQTSIAEVDAFE